MLIIVCRSTSISHLLSHSFSYNGHFLLTGSDDGHVFVTDGRAVKNFETLGYVGESLPTIHSWSFHVFKFVTWSDFAIF